ncbi:MAG: hypothetical protein J1E80_02315 [Desulfovibrionaceae bacterium]|nr:hypothetical protein [Desulfovibrionaceae bacterium]
MALSLRLWALLGVMFLVGGCAAINTPSGRGNLDLTTPGTLYSDSRIYLGDIQVMVHPNVNLERSPTALFVPLGLTQDMNDSLPVSEGVSRQVWQQFLSEGTFPTLELANMAPPYRVDLALPLAQAKGADMLVGGYITYYLDGGQTGSSKISLHLEVYDVKSGDMLWSIAHAGTLPCQPARDFLLVQIKNRMPADPMSTLIAAVAGDMATLLHMWTSPKSFQGSRLSSGSFSGSPAGDSSDSFWKRMGRLFSNQSDSAFGRF